MTAAGPRILIVEAPYYAAIADALRKGATATLDTLGATYQTIAVPGAFEVPAAIAWTAKAWRFDGYLALGCVIRGETSHYDYVCGESARALQDLAVREGLAIGYGILTVENEAQAWARADLTGKKNKGAEAASAVMAMVALRRSLGREPAAAEPEAESST